jgi:hypothetical protein
MAIIDSNALFRFLAEVRQDLILFTIQLGRTTALSNVQSGVDVREYADPITRPPSKVCFEAYVEADVAPEVGLCWWFELTLSNDGWILSRRILRDAREGQDTLYEIPDRVFQDSAQFTSQAHDLVRDLVNLATIQDILKAVRKA